MISMLCEREGQFTIQVGPDTITSIGMRDWAHIGQTP